MRIGLLGGSFDPIHNAHIAVAQTALQQQQLDAVELIPAGQPWQKPALKATPEQRSEMIRIATEGLAGLNLNRIELERSGATYTIDTLEMLDNAHIYYWILGSDQLSNFCSWHRWQDVAKRVTLLVAARPAAPLDIPQALQQQIRQGLARVEYLPFEPISISASDLRERLANGQSTSGMLNPQVAQYIAQHRLYQKPAQE